ncbi:serine/threonine-protein phosphatase PGAM5, mitochondrial isoform X2 [Hemicordylus capensis]|uniref:serine/threonine-protein phosphatase PGAM5, mitochondrial isoform X2 n=1 Tax=Hemicordylus capensis TaxID=884348 RepID=UPI00230356A9|nr:serine/threonine-protein phosphatase PGAM5, mitochondrial isoform X2 [Hemicordylus capensis]
MAFRRVMALTAAACGLAGGSVLLSAVAVGKQPQVGLGGGDGPPEPRLAGPPPSSSSSSPSAPPPPPGLLLLPSQAASCPAAAAPGWLERANGCGYWDSNWDRREPQALMNLKKKKKKKNEETGEEEDLASAVHYKAKATRHIFLIRHSQYNMDGQDDSDRTLTHLGREQAELTGKRLASLGLKYDRIVHSSMTRATETTNIISKHLPGVKKSSTDLLREGAPIEPNPPTPHWKPEAVYYEDGARIEAAFRNFIHRADVKQEEDSYEIFICHSNVIRYIVCRALQFPPEGWLRLTLNNGSITHLVIRPSGRVALRMLGDTGFMPPEKITRS